MRDSEIKFLRGNTGILLVFFGYLYLLLLILNLRSGHDFDLFCWYSWSAHILEHGLANAYTSTTNYPPLFLYVLYVVGQIQGEPLAIQESIHTLKNFVVLFDFAAVIVLVYYLNRFGQNVLLALFIAFNVAFFYNTLVWGQVDGIHTFLVFMAVLCAYHRKLALSVICLVLALNMKLQAVIFIPLLVMLYLPIITSQWERFPKAIGIGLLVQLVIVLPFIIEGSIGGLWKIVSGSVDYYQVVSMNAYNLWHLIFPTQNLMTMPDTRIFWGVSYKWWGLGLFFLFAVVALLPLFARAVRKCLEKEWAYDVNDLKLFLLTASLIPLIFFFFNTQMHERYVHPAILFAGAYAIFSHRYLFYAIVSTAYFLNIEGTLKAFQLGNYHTLIFESWFIAALFLLALFIGLYQLYVQFGREVGFLINTLTQRYLERGRSVRN